eukprot:TRINITY_DN56832_c0_g1_i1.p1 TRINITY_DN56832_c0_g1~~TRINITY_DN56832_c0_g1_i1.p1  ORF type:complete len:366 (+),score=53.84 TRINITY_DN56832_c0_g1_i1:69-1166(+)
MACGASFVDYYAILQCNPEAPLAELRHAYNSRLRKLHSGRVSPHLQQHAARELHDAWVLLKDPEQRKTYDAVWRENRWAALGPDEKAGIRYRQGCKLLLQALNIAAQAEAVRPANCSSAVLQYRAALAKFSEGIDLAPDSYKLRIGRAACFAKLHDWQNCREDALCANVLEPGAVESFALLARALWQEGWHLEARSQLSAGLAHWPDNCSLLILQEEFRVCPTAIQHGGVFTLKVSATLAEPDIGQNGAPDDCSPGHSPAHSEHDIRDELAPALSKVLAKVLLPSRASGAWPKIRLKSHAQPLAEAGPPTSLAERPGAAVAASACAHFRIPQSKHPPLPPASKHNVLPQMPTLLASRTPKKAVDG